MADSPAKKCDQVFCYTVYSEGEAVRDAYRLTGASVRLAVNRIGKATLRFDAGDMPSQQFPETDADTFKPGASIRLDAGTMDAEKTIFEGNVVSLNIEISEGNRSQMVVECRDMLYPATLGRKNRIFEKQKDSEILSALLGSYGSVEVDTTAYQHPVLVQYYATDWDFALSRADANGFLIACKQGKITVKKPAVGDKPVLTVTYGADLIDFQGGISATEQFAAVEAVSWDVAKQTLVKTNASNPALNKQGSTSPSDLEVGELLILQTDAPTEEPALKAWADSVALKAGLARFRGSFSFSGNAMAVPGCIIELKGLGARFNGNVFVGAVEHTLHNQVWTTRAEMGIDPNGITEEPDVTAPPAGGWLPGIEGLHVGKVRQLEDDPAKEERILVEIPVLNKNQNCVWARWCTPYAGKERGWFFVPEVGDEVVVGFFNHDPGHPVILGNLYSSRFPFPYGLKAENYKKAVVTREKLKIEFDEEKKVITIETPGKNKIELNDDGKLIKLTDQNKNEIIMDDKGITLNSGGKITLNAKSDLVAEATGKITATAKADITLEGMNVNASAKTGFKAKGNATAEVSASGQTTIKGGMVMIN